MSYSAVTRVENPPGSSSDADERAEAMAGTLQVRYDGAEDEKLRTTPAHTGGAHLGKIIRLT